MSAHQSNHQAAPATGTYQYQYLSSDQVVEIPSNINYQLENIISAGGVSIDNNNNNPIRHTSLCSQLLSLYSLNMYIM